MKIIHITQFLGIGGLEKIIYHLIIEQQKAGHDVTLYVYDYDREWVPFFRSSGINVITPKVKKPGLDLGLFKSFNQDLMNCDVLHSHDMNPLVYLGPLVFLRRLFFLKTPRYVHTTHGMAHIERVPRYRFIEKYLTPLADKIICVSKKIENLYKDQLHVKPKKLVTIENGIKTYDGEINGELRNQMRNWLIQRHQLNKDLPILLCLSRVLPLKDQKFLIDIINTHPQYQLIIAGPASDENYYQELKKIAKSNIYLVGPQELVSDYNLGADIFVTASTHEGIPVAVLEAMSVETPVLASRIPGHLTLNNYGDCIEFFELNNRSEFSQKLDHIINNVNLSKNKFARKVVEDNYSVKKMVSEYMKEYIK